MIFLKYFIVMSSMLMFVSEGNAQLNPEVLNSEFAQYFNTLGETIDAIPGIDQTTKEDLKRRISSPSAQCILTVRTYEYDTVDTYWKSLDTDYPAKFEFAPFPSSGSPSPFQGVPMAESYSVTTAEVSASTHYNEYKTRFLPRRVNLLGEGLVITDRASGVSLKHPHLNELGRGMSGDDPQDWVYNFSGYLTISKPGQADKSFSHLSGNTIFPSCHHDTPANDCPVEKNYIFKCEEIKENILGTEHLKILEGQLQ